MTDQAIPSAPINFTPSAARKVSELIEEEGNPNLKLRVFISGGGCSGFQYGFSFDDKVNPDDMIIEKAISKFTPPKKYQCKTCHFIFEETANSAWQNLAKDWKCPQCSAAKSNFEMLENEDEGEAGQGGDTITVTLLVDPMSYAYLAGAKISFRKDVNGEQFVIQNPNAKTTCGCGSSFSS